MSNYYSRNYNNKNKKRRQGQRVTKPEISPLETTCFVDLPIGPTSISTSGEVYKLLGPIAGTTGILAKFPQIARPVIFGNSDAALQCRVIVKHMSFHLNLVGAQSTTLTAGDLFNRVRLVLIHQAAPYTDNFTAIPTIDTGLDLRDMMAVYKDEMVNLSSPAFNSSTGYNVPACETRKWDVVINKQFQLYSKVTNTTDWDTRYSTLVLVAVSDSTLTPHPILSGHVRIQYRIISR